MPQKKPTMVRGIADALMRQTKGTGVKISLDRLPTNRQEARRLMKGNGPHMRFRRIYQEDGSIVIQQVK